MGRTDPLPTDGLIGVHVLVVGDDPDARHVIRTVLEYCGASLPRWTGTSPSRSIRGNCAVWSGASPPRDRADTCDSIAIARCRCARGDRRSAGPGNRVAPVAAHHGPARSTAARCADRDPCARRRRRCGCAESPPHRAGVLRRARHRRRLGARGAGGAGARHAPSARCRPSAAARSLPS